MIQDPYSTRPWLHSYPVCTPADIDTAEFPTVVDIFKRSVASFSERPAFESFGSALTYRNLGCYATNIAAWLQSQGLEPGDRVAIMSPNVLAYPAILFGTLIAGGVVVNVNPLYTADELEYQLNDSGARFLFVFENFAHTVDKAWSRLTVKQAVIVSPGDLMGIKGHAINIASRYVKKIVPTYKVPNSITLAKVLRRGLLLRFTPVAVTPKDVAFLQYTGGTTGVAKGATLSHGNVAANVVQTWTWLRPQLEHLGTHKMITALPLYHIFGLTACCLMLVHIGGSCVLIANPRDLDGFVSTLRKTKFTLFSGVNTLYAALADHKDINKVNFASLVFSVAGGMATQQVIAKRWKALTGTAIVEGFGLSETSPILTINRPDIEDFTGTIGYPLPSTVVSIRDSDGNPVPFGERGELVAIGPQVMQGYWQRPNETAQAMTTDGYFRTGDVAVMAADGAFKIVDRLKDMILVSGFNVYPNEIEEVLSKHPKVKEVAVIGVPYKHSGEAPLAFIVPRDETLTSEELKAYAHERLTGYKTPKFYEFREALPKSNVGKILRRELREEYLKTNP